MRGGPAQGLGITAAQDRWMLDGSGPGVGVVNPGDLKVSAGLGLAASIAPGSCSIRAYNAAGARGGLYHLSSDSVVSRTHPSADPTNPRIDQIVAKVVDQQEQGAATQEDIVIVPGLATSGATLDNRTGAALLPANTVLLADALVPTNAASSALFTYRDRRAFADEGNVPPIRTPTNSVMMLCFVGQTRLNANANNLNQYAMLHYLPRRITATRIRWVYRQSSGTASTAVYNIGVYDASGRKIVETGALASTGISNTIQVRSEVITSTTFEPGAYYVCIGWSSIIAAGVPWTWSSGISGGAEQVGPNTMLYSTTGGTTLPQTLASFIDLNVTNSVFTVPLIMLSDS
jgi:hypothetical protein